MTSFKLPDGVQVPDGKQVGDTFSAMTEYKILDGGKVSPQSIDGEDLDGVKDDEQAPNDSANDDTTQPGIMGSLRQRLMGGS